jgi:cysteinyl-tRNA synthetase
VLGYLSIGAAENYRPYWKASWKKNPPSWLGKEDPLWPGSYPVRYWDPAWQKIVMDSLAAIVAAGFDGVFLDLVDAYQNWSGSHPSAQNDMAAFVDKLGQAARASYPGFLLVGQNAEPLLKKPLYLNAIDGVSKESLYTGLQGLGVNNLPSDIAWSMNYLVPAKRAGRTILGIEYLDDPVKIEAVRKLYQTAGFTPFFGSRLLDRLP